MTSTLRPPTLFLLCSSHLKYRSLPFSAESDGIGAAPVSGACEPNTIESSVTPVVLPPVDARPRVGDPEPVDVSPPPEVVVVPPPPDPLPPPMVVLLPPPVRSVPVPPPTTSPVAGSPTTCPVAGLIATPSAVCSAT